MKEKVERIISKTFNCLKRKKFIVFILLIFLLNILIYGVWQFNNEIKYGKFYFFKKLPNGENTLNLFLKNPKTFGIRHFEPYGIKIDAQQIIFFIKNKNNETYNVYNLNLKEKKFTKYNAEFNYSKIEFAKKINDKIYMVFSKFYNDENFKNETEYDERSYIIIYDYEKDVIENEIEIEEVLKTPAYGIQTVNIKGENYIIYQCAERCHILKKSANPYAPYRGEFLCQNKKPNYYYKLFSTKTNKIKELNLKGIDKKEDIFLGQMENGVSIFYRKENGYKISAWDLGNNKKLSEYDTKINAYKFEIILIGDNKFLLIYRPYNNPETATIETFDVDTNGKIKKIAALKISDKKDLFFKRPFFSNQNYIVLSPDKVIFCCGRQSLGTYIYNSKKTYLFNYKTNEFKRITDFKYKAFAPKFIKLDGDSFLIYSTESETSPVDFIFSLNKIYKFDLKKGM